MGSYIPYIATSARLPLMMLEKGYGSHFDIVGLLVFIVLSF
jgi:hypothetical protein